MSAGAPSLRSGVFGVWLPLLFGLLARSLMAAAYPPASPTFRPVCESVLVRTVAWPGDALQQVLARSGRAVALLT